MDLCKEHWSKKDYVEFVNYLNSISEEDYRAFNENMIPCDYPMLGIRIPKLRKLAKEIVKGDWKSYLQSAKDESHEEVMLQGMVIAMISRSIGFSEMLRYITYYVPKMQSWALVDIFCGDLKLVAQHQEEAFFCIVHYIKSKQEYQVRFGVVMLMHYYLDELHIKTVFKLFDTVKHEGYYVKMALAWAISVAFIKMQGETLAYLQQNQLHEWIYQKALQKILESNRVDRVTKEQIRAIKKRRKHE